MSYRKAALIIAAGVASFSSPAFAARVITAANADVSSTPYVFNFQGSSFTFGFNGDYFGGGPLTISTGNGGAVNTIFGQPTTNFADGRGGPVTFGPTLNYDAFATATPIRFTNGDNFIGLRATVGTGTYYGYAFSTNNVIRSIGFENVADATITAVTGVPEPTTWAMSIAGVGMIGGALRRRPRTRLVFA